jgi:hypothetical protein
MLYIVHNTAFLTLFPIFVIILSAIDCPDIKSGSRPCVGTGPRKGLSYRKRWAYKRQSDESFTLDSRLRGNDT